jgi:hypothetical protein
MNYLEAIRLAQAWTKDHDIQLDGWRSVILLLYRRIEYLESFNLDLQVQVQPLEARRSEYDSQTDRR